LPPITEAKLAEIKHLLQNKDMAGKLGPKLSAKIDSLLSKKENFVFNGFVALIWKITNPEISHLVRSCSLGFSWSSSYNDSYRSGLQLSYLPLILPHPYIRKLGIDSTDCITILKPISKKQLKEAKKFEEQYFEKRTLIQRPSKWKAETNINLTAKLYISKKYNVKDTTLAICVLLSEKWSKKIEKVLKQKGLRNIKKIRDYLIEGRISSDKIEELFTNPYVIFLGLTDERNGVEVIEYEADHSTMEPL